MKTLYLHGSPDFYGAGKVLLDILQIPGNAEEAIVIFPHEGPLCEPIRKMGIPIQILNMGVLRKKYFTPLGIASRFMLWIRSVVYLRGLIKKENIDRVYINSLAVIIGPWLKSNQKVKIVWHLHEIVEGPFVLKFLLTRQLKKVDQILAVSKAAQQHWQELLPHQPVQLLYNGIDLEMAPLQSENQAGPIPTSTASDFVIGMIGRIQERKGQSYLLRIVETMRSQAISETQGKFKVIIAGDAYPGYEDLTHKLEQEIKARGLEDQVLYIGYQKIFPGFFLSSIL